MLLAGAAMRGDKERHGKNGKRDEPGDQRIGFGQCERNLTPDPEALMVDRFLAKQPGGHRQLLDLNPRPRGPNRSGCAACADIAPAVGTLDTRGQASDDRRTDEPDQSSARYPLPYAAPLRSLLLARSGLGTGSR